MGRAKSSVEQTRKAGFREKDVSVVEDWYLVWVFKVDTAPIDHSS